MALVVIEEDRLKDLLNEVLNTRLRPVEEKLERLDKDELIGLNEALSAARLNRTQFYAYIHEGIIKSYGEGRKPLFYRHECQTARKRRKDAQAT